MEIQNITLFLLSGILTFFIWKIFYPLLVAIQYKLKYKDQIVIRFLPFLGAFGLQLLSEKRYGDNQQWIREIRKANPKCKAIMTNLLFAPELFVIDTEMVREALITHADKYKICDLLYASDMYFDNGLIFSYGHQWKRQRELISNAFSFQALKNRVPIVKHILNQQCSELSTTADGSQTVNIIKECQKITGEVIVRSFFGKDFSAKKVDGVNSIDIVSTFIYDCINVTFNPFYFLKTLILGKKMAAKVLPTSGEKIAMKKILALRKLALETIDDGIKNFNKDCEPKILLDYYLRELLLNNNSPVTKDEIIHQFVSFYFAGMDTTANLAGKSIYFLGMYPEVYKKVEQEIDQHFNNPDDIQHEDLEKLTYCNAYLAEILRYSAPAPILGYHDILKPFKLGDIELSTDIMLDVSFHSILRDPCNYVNPDEFNPERQLDPNLPKQGYLPFGAGKRNCIGQHLALIEARIILVYFVKKFKILFNQDKKIVMGSPTLYTPLDDGLVRLKLRSNI